MECVCATHRGQHSPTGAARHPAIVWVSPATIDVFFHLDVASCIGEHHQQQHQDYYYDYFNNNYYYDHC